MTTPANLNIGFLKPGVGRTHYDQFAAMIPPEINLDMQDLGIMQTALTDFAARADSIIERAVNLARQRQWQALIVPGAPVEVQNPGLRQRLANALNIPFTTALAAGELALRAYNAQRILLMTPFDPHMNNLVVNHLANAGLHVQLADLGFASEQEALDLPSQTVLHLTRRALSDANNVHAIYFQGAVLNPLPIIDQMENELALPIISSNPAMLWAAASALGARFSIPSKGRLVKEWPPLP